MTVTNPDDSSRFEEVTDQPATNSTPPAAAASSTDLPTRDRPAQAKTSVEPALVGSNEQHEDDVEGDSDYEDAHEDSVWWTPEELSVSVLLQAAD